jgi:T5orf172 domain
MKNTYKKITKRGHAFVYAAKFENGIVKIGCTRDANQRVTALIKHVEKQYSAKILDIFFSEELEVIDAQIVERKSLKLARTAGCNFPKTHEYFKGITHEDAIQFIKDGIDSRIQDRKNDLANLIKEMEKQPLWIDYFTSVVKSGRTHWNF